MRDLRLSKTLAIPADIGTETIAILGRRGSGKSNTATAMIEELITAGQQVVLIDPKGEGWGLKAQGHGGPGLDVIVFGEPEGDLPLREEHGETIADFVVRSGRSCVLSLAGIDSDAAARRFVARFAERLFTLKKKPENHSPLMVVIEEAHLFVPQRVEGAHADVVSRLQRLVRQGRSMGLGVMLVDQRPASVNKDVLTQVELMVCHQLTSPHDRKAVDAWIEANAEPDQAAEFRRTLPTLAPGEAWIWSPAKLKLFERIRVRRRSTFDSGSTPILGKNAAARPKMRDVDLDELRGELDRVVEERKANDPAELKKQIADLQKQIAARPADLKLLEIKTVEKPVVTDRQIERLEKLQDRVEQRVEAWWKKASEGINPLMKLLNGQRGEIVQLRNGIAAIRPIAEAKPILQPPTRNPDPPPRSAARPPAAVGDLKITSTQQRILDALAWYESLGNRQPTLNQIGAVALIDPTGGHFSNVTGPLSTGGLIIRGSGVIELTDAGRAVARAPRSAVSLDDYHEVLRQRIRKMKSAGGKTIEILNAIVGAGGKSLTTEEIGNAVGIDPTGGHFSNMIGPLGTAGLIERRSGTVTPTHVLFPEGLR